MITFQIGICAEAEEDFGNQKMTQIKIRHIKHFTLFLAEFSKLLAPFMPFISDEIFRNLTEKESVHLEDWPKANEDLIDEELNARSCSSKINCNTWPCNSWKKKIRVRQPLQKVQIVLSKSIKAEVIENQREVILEELNVKELEIINDAKEIADVLIQANAKLLGPKYGKEVQSIINAAKSWKL